jgi:hypothetical protein
MSLGEPQDLWGLFCACLVCRSFSATLLAKFFLILRLLNFRQFKSLKTLLGKGYIVLH